MSVINDMLRDLEQRNAPERNVISPDRVTHLVEPNNRKWLSKWMVVSLVIIAGMGLGEWLFSSEGVQKSIDFVTGPVAEDSEYKVTTNVATQTLESQPPVAITTVDSNPEQSIVSVKPLSQMESSEILTSESIAALEPTSAGIQTQLYGDEVTFNEKELNQNLNAKTLGEQADPSQLLASEQLSSERLELETMVSMEKHSVLPPQVLDQNNAEQALLLFEENKSRQAYRQLYDFIAENNINSKSRLVLASYLLEDGRLEEAGDILVRASIDKDPDMRQLKARWLLASNKSNMALHTLVSHLPPLDQFPDYYALLASYYQQLGYPEKAAETYSLLVQYDENSADWWAGLGVALDSAEQFANARLAYQRALKLPGLNRQLVDFMKNRLEIFGA